MKTTFEFRSGGRSLASMVSLAVWIMVHPAAFGQTEQISGNQGIIRGEAARVRTLADMESFSQNTVLQEGVVRFHPTMDETEYERAKAAADATPVHLRTLNGILRLDAPVITGSDFNGADQTSAEGTTPPDTHGAVGLSQFVEVTNFHIDVYDLSGGLQMDQSLQAFFGATEFLFDPRVVYDPVQDRWIIMATRAAGSIEDPARIIYIGVSMGPDARGGYFIYAATFFGGSFADGDWWDFPQLGMDSCAIILTGNIVGPGRLGAYRFSVAAAIPKNILYFGLGFLVPAFRGPVAATIAPPIVLDANPNTYLVAAPESGTVVTKYTMTNTCIIQKTMLSSSSITVPAYSLPPSARQPGTTARLDTADSRFINASTQNGDSLWQVHTVDMAGRPTPKYYEFDTVANTVVQSSFFSASATSDDWNASIAANRASDLFVTYSSTDIGAPNLQAQVRFSGRCHNDPAIIGAGVAVITSGTFSEQLDGTRYRWGDYSAVTVQPTDSNMAWIVNEWTPSDSQIWGSRITQIGFSPTCP